MRWLALVLCLPLLAGAQGNERQRLAAEREALVQRFAAEEQACRERFVVTACVDDVRQRRRAALGPLRERELQLADAERLRRAQDRQAARAARPLPVPVPRRAASTESSLAMPLQAAPQAVPLEPLEAASPNTRRTGSALRGEDELSRSAQAAGRVRAAARRSEAAEETRAEVARRQEQRSVNTKRSAPLTTPAASAAKR